MTPIISIIVPCYNQAPYLPETLQSVLNQEYTPWECIIVNDGSSDNSEEIALEWVNKDPRFKYFSKPNSGVADTRNYGISHSVGKYILPLDADDKISPQYIKEAIAVFKSDEEVKLVYSNRILFGEKDRVDTLPEYKFENMFIENQIFNSAIFRREDFSKIDGYNPNMVEGLEDWDFWLTLLNANDKVVKLDGFHYFYRIKDVSRSTMIDYEKNERLLLQMFKNHVDLCLEHFNPIRAHIEADYYKRKVVEIKQQPEYRIGSFIYNPIRFIKKAFSKLTK